MPTKAGPMVLVVVVVVAVGGFFLWQTATRGSDCDALNANVDGFEGWDDGNGITSYGADWVGVLAQAPTHADAPSRERIAVAVRADRDGFERFRSALPEGLEADADRVYAVVVDPAADAGGRQVRGAERAIARHVSTTCNVAL